MAMDDARHRFLFWCLVAGQAAGSQFLIWNAAPLYHGIRTGAIHGARGTDLALALAAASLMQACHWPALRLVRRLQFRRNVILGHVLVWIGELSLFFIAALATLIVFDRFGEVEWLWWKALALAAVLFAITSYKYQLMSLGEAMIDAEPDTETQPVRPGN